MSGWPTVPIPTIQGTTRGDGGPVRPRGEGRIAPVVSVERHLVDGAVEKRPNPLRPCGSRRDSRWHLTPHVWESPNTTMSARASADGLRQPKVILAAHYYGNDLYDSYQFVYRAGDRRRSAPDPVLDSAFAQTDPKSREAIARAETIDPELLRLTYLDCRNPVEVPDSRLQATRDVLTLPPPRVSACSTASRAPRGSSKARRFSRASSGASRWTTTPGLAIVSGLSVSAICSARRRKPGVTASTPSRTAA